MLNADFRARISDGVLLTWGFNNTLYAFDPVDGAFLWDYTVEVFPGNPSTPAVIDGIVYGGDMRGNAFALDISDGSEIWQVSFPTGGPVGVADNRAAVVYADDLGYGDLSIHGGETPTPQIDSLFRQGVELGNFRTWAVCSPSRASPP